MWKYVPPPGGYPTGPVSCDEDHRCQPVLASVHAPPVVAYFTFCGVCLLVTAAAAGLGWLRKRRQQQHMLHKVHSEPGRDSAVPLLSDGVGTRGRERRGSTQRLPTSSSGSGGTELRWPHSAALVVDGSERYLFEGYRSDIFGTLGLLAACMFSLALLALYIFLLVDYYGGCQMNGPDAAW